MSDVGGYMWFVALGAGILALGGALFYGQMRNRARGHRPGRPD